MWRLTQNLIYSSSPRYKDDELKYRHIPASQSVIQISSRLLYVIIGCLVFGVLLLFINVIQLRSLNTYGGSLIGDRPVAWVYAPNLSSGYLDHLLNVLSRVGYLRTDNKKVKWDLLWAHDYPFAIDHIKEDLKQLEVYQKVNHFPGSGFVCNKNSLATSHFPFHPIAFSIPKDKDKFLEEVKNFPGKMWVEKSNSHRGIRIKSSQEIDMSGKSKDTFIEEFISNPYLIDGRKFDIGIYTVLTSINPLRVYIFENEVLIRFCLKDYKPLDPTDEKQYVIGDDYTQPWKLPSLKSMWKTGRFSRKQLILTHIKKEGKDADKVWRDMLNAIQEVYVNKEANFISSTNAYRSTRNFFEMVRFDFILDENMNVWLMEANMSPNLSSSAHPENAVMYEQVIFNLFGLVGVASRLAHTTSVSSEAERRMMVNDYDIATSYEVCSSRACETSCINPACQVCYSCLTEEQRSFIKTAYYEHVHKGGFRRVYPPPMSPAEARIKKTSQNLSPSNYLMEEWLRQKCLRDSSWCQ